PFALRYSLFARPSAADSCTARTPRSLCRNAASTCRTLVRHRTSVSCLSEERKAKSEKRFPLHHPHKVLPRQLPDAAAQLQFEQGAEDIRRRKVRRQALDQLVNVNGFVRSHQGINPFFARRQLSRLKQ